MVDSVREQLLASHEEFRRLAQEHTQYCQRLHSLIEKRYLTEDEKLEEVRIKKVKLRLKDQMQMIEQRQRSLDGSVWNIPQLGPAIFHVGLDGRHIFGEGQLETYIGIHVALGDMMQHLAHRPSARTVGSIELNRR